MQKTNWLACIGMGITLSLGSASVSAAPFEPDPYEGFNRAVFKFNDTLDRILLKPVAKGYKFITPEPIDQGITNFFNNLGEIGVIINDVLQGKFEQAGSDTSRFVINSTIGIVGILDVATDLGYLAHDEDFGQTFAVYGAEESAYIVLPFFGPSTIRDAVAAIPQTLTNPVVYVDSSTQFGLRVVDLLDTRGDLLAAESVISGDRYAFIRDAYLQTREFQIKDGIVEDSFDDFDDEDL